MPWQSEHSEQQTELCCEIVCSAMPETQNLRQEAVLLRAAPAHEQPYQWGAPRSAHRTKYDEVRAASWSACDTGV